MLLYTTGHQIGTQSGHRTRFTLLKRQGSSRYELTVYGAPGWYCPASARLQRAANQVSATEAKLAPQVGV